MTGGRRTCVLVAALGLTAAWIGAPSAGALALSRAPADARVISQDLAEAPITIVIDELLPLIPGPDDEVRIRGRVISNSETPISDVSIQVRRSATPIVERRDIARISEAGLDPVDGDPDGTVLYSTRTVIAQELKPGSRKAFTLRFPVSQLAFPEAGTYVLGLEAIGREAGVDEFDSRKGVLRTFLPWYPQPSDVTPIDLVWLWPLADWPARTADGVLLDNRTPAELSPGGRLARLVQIGDRYRGRVSWVSDPALLQTASEMTDGYQVIQDGTATVGDREQDAKRWLANLAEATATPGMRSLPYADIDAAAVTRAGMSNDVVRAVTQGPGIATAAIRAPVPGAFYWAPFGRIDRPTANVLASAGVTTLVLGADAMPATDETLPTEGMPTTALPTSVGAIRAVLTDRALTQTLALPQRSASDVIIARQRFLAETSVIADTLPADQSSRFVVAAPESVRWDPTASLLGPLLRATGTAPWLAASSLEDLLAAPVSSTSRQRGGYGPKARSVELSPTYMARVARAADQLAVFTSIIDDPTGISEPYSAALLRAESAAWRSATATGEKLLTSIEGSLAEQTAKVRVLSEGTLTFSGDTGRVPVTIANDLDRSVTVGLTLRGRPPLRLSSESLTGIRIEAGTMASVDIDARVVGGDPLTVEVQLLGPDGEDYGKPATITVTSTAYARAAAVVVAAAFVAIAVFVVFGVTRRIRAARSSRSGAGMGT